MKTTTDALKMTAAERATSAASRMPGFWNRQAENTLDRATAMMPKTAVRAARRDRLRFRRDLPDRRAAPAAHQGRRDAARRHSRLQHRLGRLFPRSRGPHDAGGDHPDAHAGRGDRGARVRHEAARLEGRHVRQRHAAAGASGASDDPDAARFTVWYDVLGIDSPYDYDPVWTKCVELEASRRPSTAARSGQGLRNSPTQLRLQPHRPFRGGRPRGRQGASSWAA